MRRKLVWLIGGAVVVTCLVFALTHRPRQFQFLDQFLVVFESRCQGMVLQTLDADYETVLETIKKQPGLAEVIEVRNGHRTQALFRSNRPLTIARDLREPYNSLAPMYQPNRCRVYYGDAPQPLEIWMNRIRSWFSR